MPRPRRCRCATARRPRRRGPRARRPARPRARRAGARSRRPRRSPPPRPCRGHPAPRRTVPCSATARASAGSALLGDRRLGAATASRSAATRRSSSARGARSSPSPRLEVAHRLAAGLGGALGLLAAVLLLGERDAAARRRRCASSVAARARPPARARVRRQVDEHPLAGLQREHDAPGQESAGAERRPPLGTSGRRERCRVTRPRQRLQAVGATAVVDDEDGRRQAHARVGAPASGDAQQRRARARRDVLEAIDLELRRPRTHQPARSYEVWRSGLAAAPSRLGRARVRPACRHRRPSARPRRARRGAAAGGQARRTPTCSTARAGAGKRDAARAFAAALLSEGVADPGQRAARVATACIPT